MSAQTIPELETLISSSIGQFDTILLASGSSRCCANRARGGIIYTSLNGVDPRLINPDTQPQGERA